MVHQVEIPPAGESITSATVAQWHAADGAAVELGQRLATIETDKVSSELEAEWAGTLAIIVQEGEEVRIGTVIAEIDDGLEEGGEPAEKSNAGSEDAEPPAVVEASRPDYGDDGTGEERLVQELRVPAAGEAIFTATVAQWHRRDGELVSRGEPLVTLETDKASNELEAGIEGTLRIVSPQGADAEIGTLLGMIEGSAESQPAVATGEGPVRSVSQASPAQSPSDAADPRPECALQPLAPVQGTTLTVFNEADMSAVILLRRQVQDDFVAKHGVKLGFMALFVKAAVQALRDVPVLNAQIIENEEAPLDSYAIGIAMESGRGPLVPVVREADRKSFARIELDILAAAVKVREETIGPEDLQGGVFTISNAGVHGSLLSTPPLIPPQCGTLGMHVIQSRPVAVDGKVEIRPMMSLALSYDSRVVDAPSAGMFLVRIKEAIENPTRLMLEI